MSGKLVKYVCDTCGSDDVRWDAWAEWDQVLQEMVLNASYDASYCVACENDCQTAEVELEGDEADRAEAELHKALPDRLNRVETYAELLEILKRTPHGDEYNAIILQFLQGGEYIQPTEEGR